jgi:hypothetical protein
MKRFLALDLDNYLAIDNQVGPKTAFKFDRFVDQRDSFLTLHKESGLIELVSQASLVS